MRLQKRYLLAALLAGFAFIIFYAVFDLYLYISLILSGCVYVAGIFLYKSKDIRVYDPKSIARYYFEISKLNDYKEKVNDDAMKEKMGKIVNTCSKITKYLESQPTNATKIYNFLDYYLPFTTKIVNKYIITEKKAEKTFVENKLILKMSVYIKEIEHECNRLHSEIIKAKDRELDFEMKVFEKTSDIDDFDIESGEKNDK